MELGIKDPRFEAQTPEPSNSLEQPFGNLSPEICVICLEPIDEKVVAFPCFHHQFHFACLGTWLQHHQKCPLCKSQVYAVRYETEGVAKIFHLPRDEGNLPPQPNPTPGLDSQNPQRRSGPTSRTFHSSAQKSEITSDPALAFRHKIYAHNLYSLHVGTNRFSRYLPSGSISPELFARNPEHISRARTFIRRELKVFDFLAPTCPHFSPSVAGSHDAIHLPSANGRSIRATNREYLLDYFITILECIPLKGSEGQAEKLLADFLGMRNAKLFCHELEAWLRSPFGRLAEWDSVVQYKDDQRTRPRLNS